MGEGVSGGGFVYSNGSGSRTTKRGKKGTCARQHLFPKALKVIPQVFVSGFHIHDIEALSYYH